MMLYCDTDSIKEVESAAVTISKSELIEAFKTQESLYNLCYITIPARARGLTNAEYKRYLNKKYGYDIESEVSK